MPKLRPGVVSVILVNFRGADDIIEAVRHLGELDWPQEMLEIVVIENASGDDSAAHIRAAAPQVNLVVSKTNTGFADGCNAGVAASSGEFVALLNNDAKPDVGWVRAAVEKFAESPRIGAVATKVLDWDGELVDYLGSAMTWYGMGYKPFTAERIPSTPDLARDVVFGTGAAMFVRRSVYDDLGGFDERYFMFFEDVDFGWRLNLRGWRFVYEPRSLAFHKHHASMNAFGSFKETYLLERNALFTLYKNLGDDALSEALPAAMALTVRRAMANSTGRRNTGLLLRLYVLVERFGRGLPSECLAGPAVECVSDCFEVFSLPTGQVRALRKVLAEKSGVVPESWTPNLGVLLQGVVRCTQEAR